MSQPILLTLRGQWFRSSCGHSLICAGRKLKRRNRLSQHQAIDETNRVCASGENSDLKNRCGMRITTGKLLTIGFRGIQPTKLRDWIPGRRLVRQWAAPKGWQDY